MLAGYLPFDDDPANPDGDNINLLYKYIVTTPLTFPEYVTPHARDLLRRILVPDPRKRADLFEVARHSWLSEYSHIVSHITSSTTQVSDIANTTVPQEKPRDAPALARSASVKEPPKSHQSTIPSVGALSHQPGDISQDHSSDRSKTSRDTKRRTVQVEYVAPQSQTARGEAPTDLKIVSPPQAGPVEVAPPQIRSNSQDAANNLPYGIVPQDASMEQPKRKAPSGAMPSRPPGGHLPRSTSESTPLTATATGPPTSYPARPPTGGSMTSFNGGRLPSRGSYGQPVAPTVAQTNAEGRLAQPKSKQYQISGPIPQDQSIGRPSAQPLPPRFNATPQQEPPKGHKRSNTVSGISEKLFMRTGSIFGGRGGQSNARQKTKRPPPTSMREPYGGDDSRMSVDSRRSMYGRKTSEAGSDSRPRRFSLLPPSFSLKGLSSSRSQTPDEDPHAEQPPPDHRLQQAPSTGAIRPRARATSYATPDAMGNPPEGAPADEVVDQDEPINDPSRIEQHISELHGMPSSTYQPTYSSASAEQVYPNHEHDHYYRHRYANHSTPSYYDDYTGPGSYSAAPRQSTQTGRSGRGSGVLHKNHRKFADAYEYERDLAHQPGSSGAARKVMDFFRRRAKSRVGDDR